MSLYNYITETDLKGYIPELSRYLWSGETDYTKQKVKAEQIVLNDFINRGHKATILRPNLDLRTSTATITASSTGTSYEDTQTRMRFGYNVTVRTGTTSLVLQGSDDETTWNTITTISITATGIGSEVFLTPYKYYRVNSTITAGTLAFTAWLTETNYDLWFAYKWLELILMNAYTAEDDQYYKRMEWFKNAYGDLWDSASILDSTIDEPIENAVRFGR